jgi:hypothetical protein
MTILVLASVSDLTAIRVAAALQRRRGAMGVQLRTPQELALAPLWEHRVDDSGVETRIGLHDETQLPNPRVIFNRVQQLESWPLQQAQSQDRDYGQAEVWALLLSWLTGASCPVVNRPSPSGLAGNIMRPLVWRRLAQRAGLSSVGLFVTTSTRRFPLPHGVRFRSDLSWQEPYFRARSPLNQFCWASEAPGAENVVVHVVGGRAFGDVTPAALSACVRLAELAQAELLQVELVRSSMSALGVAFQSANTCPCTEDGGVIAAIADFLEELAPAQRLESA